VSNGTTVELEPALMRRIIGEYMEMPGLRLTGPQAQRLLGLDGPRCQAALDALVDAHLLRRLDDGRYAREADGPAPRTAFRMTTAGLPAKQEKSSAA